MVLFFIFLVGLIGTGAYFFLNKLGVAGQRYVEFKGGTSATSVSCENDAKCIVASKTDPINKMDGISTKYVCCQHWGVHKLPSGSKAAVDYGN